MNDITFAIITAIIGFFLGWLIASMHHVKQDLKTLKKLSEENAKLRKEWDEFHKEFAKNNKKGEKRNDIS